LGAQLEQGAPFDIMPAFNSGLLATGHWPLATRMKFGLLYLPTYVPELDGSVGEFYEHMLEQIDYAGDLGYHSVWVTEHHFDHYGGTLPNPAVFGTAIAQRTAFIRIGVAVSVLPLHHPLLVAEDYAMLDVLSNGRLDFGVGRGSVPDEYEQLGVSADDSAETMVEATELITRAWRGEEIEHRGRRFSYPRLSLLPRPVQRPHPPIWVGAVRSPETFEWAGRNGFNVMVLPYMIPPEVLKKQLAVYFAAAEKAGHDRSRLEVFAKFHVFVAEEAAEARRLAGPAYANYGRLAAARSGANTREYYGAADTSFERHAAEFKIIAGSPQDCIERIRYWRDTLGITYIGGTFHFGGLAHEATLRSMELFAQEVAPAVETPENGRRPPAGPNVRLTPPSIGRPGDDG
jgi:natural product biosynthesis luciferase-like monooxygenase protein